MNYEATTMSEHKEKFTPGPWVIYPVSVNSESCDIVAQNDPNDRIAVTCEQAINDGRELANAHLIAAAPELYEALEECALQLSYHTRSDMGDLRQAESEAVAQARAALAKARGEA